jgi:putative ubiquitin-RnfH superfamily antitoxin RatB of RatAB toxin-antitoxin module
MMEVCVAYATPTQQVEIPIQVEENCILVAAVRRSGILDLFPEIKLAEAIVGVHGVIVAMDASLKGGDRIEIYRPLKLDPKQSRRLRAKKQIINNKYQSR